ncbi:hypothetical protein BU25DRAFT_425068 [Macroventuria anomochaeta]|uniref:Uncharacterized protein n=1 Tax=Macroventuria anomochaeta TaxID=301207 RepID=A0ACB6RPW6_9PLEO|nr:uncharacterized protein BU25DRAFT_425068 [Macroventuria anomochaeta]KAF2623307.1 hypothetical protein BU25DRAFT_425068 [Macroventuria anomochaeta]
MLLRSHLTRRLKHMSSRIKGCLLNTRETDEIHETADADKGNVATTVSEGPQAPLAVSSIREESAATSITEPSPRLAIFTLPLEIFHIVGDYLPLGAQVALMLTCREFLRIYGLEKWDQIRRFHYLRLHLFHFLERKPGYYVLNKPFGYAITRKHLALYFDKEAGYSEGHSISLNNLSHSSTITAPQLDWVQSELRRTNLRLPSRTPHDTIIDLEVVPRRLPSRLLIRSRTRSQHDPSEPNCLDDLQNLGDGGQGVCLMIGAASHPENIVWTALAGGETKHDVRVLNYPSGCIRAAFNGPDLEVIKANM